jgi:hypothetical protein
MNVRTLFRGDLYTIAALDGHTREHLEVRSLCRRKRGMSCY